MKRKPPSTKGRPMGANVGKAGRGCISGGQKKRVAQLETERAKLLARPVPEEFSRFINDDKICRLAVPRFLYVKFFEGG